MSSGVIDLMIRIKNGYIARNEEIQGQYSKMNVEVLKVLQAEGYVSKFEVTENNTKKDITIELKYNEGEPVLTDVKLMSKPGRRLYTRVSEIRPVLGGLGIGVVSTPKGIMTEKNARKEKIGGEMLFKVW